MLDGLAKHVYCWRLPKFTAMSSVPKERQGKVVHPQRFLIEFVLPAITEWRSDPLSVRRATIAICELDNLAEHLVQFKSPNISRDDLRKERDRIGASFKHLALCRDIHDTHKHGRLTRKTAMITRG